jgi:hypothetical protein
MQRFSSILKLDPYHDGATGRFATSASQGSGTNKAPDMRITHASRYDEVVESNINARTDLGYFQGRTPRTYISPKELDNNATWHGAEDKLIAKLDPNEHKALNAYTGASVYSMLNRDMAAGKTRDPETLDTAKNIFTAIRKSEIPEDITLYRGMRARGVLLEGDSAIGKVYSDKIFKSTSACQDNAIQFAANKDPSVILRIKARKGQQGAYLDGKLSQNPQEQEVLLPHNAKFIITGHSTLEVKRGKMTDHIKVYECEML